MEERGRGQGERSRLGLEAAVIISFLSKRLPVVKNSSSTFDPSIETMNTAITVHKLLFMQYSTFCHMFPMLIA